MSHICPKVGCIRQCSYGKLMCPQHWRQVSATVQAQVYRTWNRGYPTEGYTEARQQAIEEVNR